MKQRDWRGNGDLGMFVYVVIADSWNGEASTDSVAGVFSTKEKAENFAASMNAKKISDYSTDYRYEGKMEIDSEEQDIIWE